MPARRPHPSFWERRDVAAASSPTDGVVLGTGATIGIALGSGILGLALLYFLFLMWRRRQRRQDSHRKTSKRKVYPAGNQSIDSPPLASLRRFYAKSLPHTPPPASSPSFPPTASLSYGDSDSMLRIGSIVQSNKALIRQASDRSVRPWAAPRRRSSRYSVDIAPVKGFGLSPIAEMGMWRSKTSPALTSQSKMSTTPSVISSSNAEPHSRGPTPESFLATRPPEMSMRDPERNVFPSDGDGRQAKAEMASPRPVLRSRTTSSRPSSLTLSPDLRASQSLRLVNSNASSRPTSWIMSQQAGDAPQFPPPPIVHSHLTAPNLRRDTLGRLPSFPRHSISSMSSVSSSVLRECSPERRGHARGASNYGPQSNGLRRASSLASSHTSDAMSFFRRSSLHEEGQLTGLSSPSKGRLRRNASHGSIASSGPTMASIGIQGSSQPFDSNRVSLSTLGGRRNSYGFSDGTPPWMSGKADDLDPTTPTEEAPATPPPTPQEIDRSPQTPIRPSSETSFLSRGTSFNQGNNPFPSRWTTALREISGNPHETSRRKDQLGRTPGSQQSQQSPGYLNTPSTSHSKRPISAFKGSSTRLTGHKRRKCVRISSRSPDVQYPTPGSAPGSATPEGRTEKFRSSSSPSPRVNRPMGARPLPRRPSENAATLISLIPSPKPPAGSPARPSATDSPGRGVTREDRPKTGYQPRLSDDIFAPQGARERPPSTVSTIQSMSTTSLTGSYLSLSHELLSSFPPVPSSATMPVSPKGKQTPSPSSASLLSPVKAGVQAITGRHRALSGFRIQGPRTPPFPRHPRLRLSSRSPQRSPVSQRPARSRSRSPTKTPSSIKQSNGSQTEPQHSPATSEANSSPSPGMHPKASLTTVWNSSSKRRNQVVLGGPTYPHPRPHISSPATPSASPATSGTSSSPKLMTGEPPHSISHDHTSRPLIPTSSTKTTTTTTTKTTMNAQKSPFASPAPALPPPTSSSSFAPHQVLAVRDSRNFAMPVPRSAGHVGDRDSSLSGLGGLVPGLSMPGSRHAASALGPSRRRGIYSGLSSDFSEVVSPSYSGAAGVGTRAGAGAGGGGGEGAGGGEHGGYERQGGHERHGRQQWSGLTTENQKQIGRAPLPINPSASSSSTRPDPARPDGDDDGLYDIHGFLRGY